jgi:predicted PurR-regulated permease PerM
MAEMRERQERRGGLLGDLHRSQVVLTAMVGVIAVVLLGAALRATYPVSMPVAMALFLAVLAHPVQAFIVHRVPRWLQWLGPLVATLLVTGVLVIGAGLVIWSVTHAASGTAAYLDRLQNKWTNLVEFARQYDVSLQSQLIREELRQQVFAFVTTGFTNLWWWLTIIVIILFLMFLLLLETRAWRLKTQINMEPESSGRAIRLTLNTAHKLRRFMLVRTLMSLLNGSCAAAYLWAIGIDFWYLWGVTVFVLNHIPNIGSVIAVIPPTIIALMQYNLGYALLAIGGLTAIDMFIGNFLDPRLMGRSLNLSPAVMLGAILLWAWIWGVVGMLLAVPITVGLIILFQEFDSLRPVAQMLAETPPKARPGNGANPRPGDPDPGERS